MYVSKDTLGIGAIILILVVGGVSFNALYNVVAESGKDEEDDSQQGQQTQQAQQQTQKQGQSVEDPVARMP